MRMKAQQVFDATLVVSTIIRENRAMPTKGKYRLARLHAKLLPEFQTLSGQRDAMITAYDHHPMIKAKDAAGVETEVLSTEFGVPADKLAEFAAAWNEIGDQEIEVDVESVPLAYLELADSVDGSVTAHELVTLGDLVRE